MRIWNVKGRRNVRKSVTIIWELIRSKRVKKKERERKRERYKLIDWLIIYFGFITSVDCGARRRKKDRLLFTKEIEDEANTRPRKTMIWVMSNMEKPNINEVLREETHARQWNWF